MCPKEKAVRCVNILHECYNVTFGWQVWAPCDSRAHTSAVACRRVCDRLTTAKLAIRADDCSLLNCLGPPRCHRDRQTAILRRCDESRWQRGQTGNWPLAQQSGREFTSAIPTKRTCNDPLQAHANLAEIRCCPRFHSHHFNLDRSLSQRDHFKANRTAALNEWRGLCAS